MKKALHRLLLDVFITMQSRCILAVFVSLLVFLTKLLHATFKIIWYYGGVYFLFFIAVKLRINYLTLYRYSVCNSPFMVLTRDAANSEDTSSAKTTMPSREIGSSSCSDSGFSIKLVQYQLSLISTLSSQLPANEGTSLMQ